MQNHNKNKIPRKNVLIVIAFVCTYIQIHVINIVMNTHDKLNTHFVNVCRYFLFFYSSFLLLHYSDDSIQCIAPNSVFFFHNNIMFRMSYSCFRFFFLFTFAQFVFILCYFACLDGRHRMLFFFSFSSFDLSLLSYTVFFLQLCKLF